MKRSVSASKKKVLFDIKDDQLLTTEQLAKRLNVAIRTVRNWRYERYIPQNCVVKLHTQVRYRWEKVLEWLATRNGEYDEYT